MEERVEIWKNIPDYEGLYQVSNLGNVKSMARFVRKINGSNGYIAERQMKFYLNKKGYNLITLFKNGVKKNFFVHRLVWIAFNGSVPSNLQINHIDEDKNNNALENLNLLTCKENINYGSRNKKVSGHYKRLKGEIV